MAFGRCTALSAVALHTGSLTEIADYAFRGCTALTIMKVPTSVRSIGYEVFRDCDTLIEVDIEDGLERIGANAFWDCATLTYVKLPRTIVAIVGARLGEGQVVVPRSIPTFIFGT
jgi:hypothetical protein